MKKYLLVFLLVTVALPLFSQKDTTSVGSAAAKSYQLENPVASITIFPVPVRNNTFTINSDRDITHVKITNIIGQDIFRNRFSGQTSVKIDLDNAKRGIYIITVMFADNTRVVRKIMIEEAG
ncbi:MAG: T9SS type A sorting domain-containing protein [Bacteroidales bacterium]|jgi:hypothetical protein|nr:T9SS type A sorting domain-containing protein [Bacteroidales bacterium]